jgi:hypothetical protein
MPRCSAIIVTYNSAAHIEACVLALASQAGESCGGQRVAGRDGGTVKALEARVPLQPSPFAGTSDLQEA